MKLAFFVLSSLALVLFLSVIDVASLVTNICDLPSQSDRKRRLVDDSDMDLTQLRTHKGEKCGKKRCTRSQRCNRRQVCVSKGRFENEETGGDASYLKLKEEFAAFSKKVEEALEKWKAGGDFPETIFDNYMELLNKLLNYPDIKKHCDLFDNAGDVYMKIIEVGCGEDRKLEVSAEGAEKLGTVRKALKQNPCKPSK